ncbi:hypothetical protein ACIA8G_19725 [Lentzea sp. NPDC051213]|uniref:hypothetical protein n=1 Tax=Lentzea sp. NPDC051213 TaxID=3364126 RepID=UPI0037BC3338
MKRLLAATLGLTLLGAVTVSAAPQTWSPTSVPVDHGDILAVDALTDKEAYAVGYRLTGLSEVEQVALKWDGVAWTQHSLLPTGSFAAAVEARSSSDIWIIGAASAHWDGAAWTQYPLGSTPAGRMVPDAIASSGDKVWIAGRQTTRSIKDGVPAVQTWNGTGWQFESLPALGIGELTGLAVVGPNDVWATGSLFVDGGAQRPLTLHWDGTSWQHVSTPTVPDRPTWLSGVTAVGPNDVWAVGGSYSDGGDLPFSMRWDGRKWTVVRTPAVFDGRLRAVGRTGTGEVWAVGGKGSVGIALRWEPRLRSWVRVPAPDVVVRGFSTVPGGGALWAVGVARQGDLVPAVVRRTR